jgi:hypothetical protein
LEFHSPGLKKSAWQWYLSSAWEEKAIEKKRGGTGAADVGGQSLSSNVRRVKT